MFTTILFPLVDSRNFIEGEKLRLKKPAWANINVSKNFIQYFGGVNFRLQGGLKEWAGEEVYCSARNAIKFPFINNEKRCEIIFRRFYNSGSAAARIEIGLKDFLEKSPLLYSDGNEDYNINNLIISLLNNYITNKITIRDLQKKSKSSLSLFEAGDKLAKLYLYASTKTLKTNQPKIKNWWVTAGQPLIYSEFKLTDGKSSELFVEKIPNDRLIKDDLLQNNGINIYYFWVTSKAGYTIRTWLVTFSEKTPLDFLRKLRINIARIHAEQESLKTILNLLKEKKINPVRDTEESNSLQAYLTKTTKALFLETRDGITNNEISQRALYYDEIVSPGEKQSLLSLLNDFDFRPFVMQQLERLLGQAEVVETDKKKLIIMVNNGIVNIDSTVHGDQAVAQNIENSFNKN